MIRRILQIVLPLAVIIGGGLGAKSLVDSYQPPEKQPVVIEPPLVRVIEAAAAPQRLTITAEGTVRPRTESQIVPEVSGKVTWVSDSLAVGGFFNKGDELLKIDRRESVQNWPGLLQRLATARALDLLRRRCRHRSLRSGSAPPPSAGPGSA